MMPGSWIGDMGPLYELDIDHEKADSHSVKGLVSIEYVSTAVAEFSNYVYLWIELTCP